MGGARKPQEAPKRRNLWFSKGVPTKWSRGRQAEVGDLFGHPQGVQVRELLGSQLESFGSLSKHVEIGPESFGIVVRRFVVTVPALLGLVWPSFRRRFPAGSLKVFWALLALPRPRHWH